MGIYPILNNTRHNFSVILNTDTTEDMILLKHIQKNIKGPWIITDDDLHPGCKHKLPQICIECENGEYIPIINLGMFLIALRDDILKVTRLTTSVLEIKPYNS